MLIFVLKIIAGAGLGFSFMGLLASMLTAVTWGNSYATGVRKDFIILFTGLMAFWGFILGYLGV